MADESNLQGPNAELEKLRAEFARLKVDMQDERMKRAEQHISQLRNWLAIYTGIVTFVFLVFALLGFRSYSDIRTSRDRVDTEAAKVQKTAQDFYAKLEDANQKFDSWSAKEKRFEVVAAENENAVGEIKRSVNMLQSGLNGLNGQYQDMQTRTNGLETQLKATSALATQTSLDTTGLRGAFTSYGLGQPTLFVSRVFKAGKNILSTIDGAYLGSTPGHLYVRAQRGFQDPSSPPSVEIGKESIREWKDSAVKFVLSSTVDSFLQEGTFKVGGRSLGVLAFQVETADGKKSLWVQSSTWPILPDN